MGTGSDHGFPRVFRLAWVLFLVFLSMGTLGAGSLKKGSEGMEITGKVHVIGNEPFTHAALRTDEGVVYALLGEQGKELRALQGRRVTVWGSPSKEKPRGTQGIEVKSFRVLEEK